MSLQGDAEDGTPPGSSHEESPAVTDEEQDQEIEKLTNGKLIEVKCGPLRAKMHAELFLCPGIHQHCIDLNGEMISPKEFTIRANKDKQKDWKGSIRIGKSNLRTLMELRTFDFFNHSQYCSAKCQSRNYITPKSERISQEGSDREHSSRRSSVKSTIEHFMATQMPQQATPYAVVKPEPQDTLSHLVQMSNVLNNNNSSVTHNMPHHHPHEVHQQIIDVDDSMSRLQPSSEQVSRLMQTDPTSFWSQMQQIGVLDEIVDSIVHEVDTLRNETRVHNITPRVCNSLSRLCASLDMADSVAARVRNRQPPQPETVISNFSDLPHPIPRKRSLDDPPMAVMPIGGGLLMTSEIKRPRIQYPPMMNNSPLIEALIKAQTAFQMHQSAAPYGNMELLLKFASQPPAMPIESAALPPQTAFNSQITDALLKMQ